jgi:hypothetical protein
VTDLATISTCIDCPTTIIGERLRCPACHQRHAAALLAMSMSMDDDDVTARRPRAGSDVTVSRLARSVIVLEVLVAVVLGFVLAVRGCAS